MLELYTCTGNLHEDQISDLFEPVNNFNRKHNLKIEQYDRGAVVNYANPIKLQYVIFLRHILTTRTRRTLAEHEELIDRSSRIQLGQIVPYLLLMCTHYAKRTLS